MPNLTWNKILNVTLQNGLLYRRYNLGEITYSANWKHITDILSSPGSKINNHFSDGSSVLITLDYDFAEPTILYHTERDKISIQLTDDLSDFDFFKVSANCVSRISKNGV